MPGRAYEGIGSGAANGVPSIDNPLPDKVCVAGLRESRAFWRGDAFVTVDRYDTVYVAPASRSPRLIDVYIDGAYWQSVRW